MFTSKIIASKNHMMMNENVVEQEFQWRNVGYQYFAAIAVNLLMINQGATLGWVTPNLPVLMSENTSLITGPFSNEDASWIVSISCIGSLVGIFTFGYLNSCIESKRTTLFLALPFLMAWLLIYFGTSYTHVLIARVISGWAGGGIQSTVVLFTSEIANDNIRGKLGSLIQLSRNIGMLICFILSPMIEYQYIPCIFATLPILFGLIFIFLPNTPQFYLRRGQIEEAEKALKYYKGFEGKSSEENKAFAAEFQRIKSVVEQHKTDETVHISDLYNRNALKAIVIGIMLGALTNATGCFTLMSYAALIFEQCGTYMDPYYSSVILAIAQIFGSLCSTHLSDSFGRKFLMIVSLVGSAFGLIFLASYLYLMNIGIDLDLFTWLPVTSLSFIVFFSSAGIIPLCSICTVEILPSKIRNIGLNINLLSICVTCFLSVKSFPIWMESIGLDISILIYALLSIVGTIYLAFHVKETKGKSMDEVISTKKDSKNVV